MLALHMLFIRLKSRLEKARETSLVHKFFAVFAAVLTATSFFPATVSAQYAPGIKGLMLSVGSIIGLLIPISAGLALLYFFWGIANYILKTGDPEARSEARQHMFWGIIGLFVITSIWGISFFLQEQFGLRPVVDLDVF
jgi:hypothetical protein